MVYCCANRISRFLETVLLITSHLEYSYISIFSTPGGTPRGPASPPAHDNYPDTGGFFQGRE